MVSNSHIAQRFVDGATSGTGNNMFIDENVVYSYGHHFPIAIRLSDGFLFNSDGYSRSTAKHKCYVKRAISGRVLECNTEQLNDAIREGFKSFNDIYFHVLCVCQEARA